MTRFDVYVMRDELGAVLYVGCSGHAGLRINQHRGEREWWDRVATVEVRHCSSKRDALSLERELIRSLSPEFNVRHSSATQDQRAAVREAGRERHHMAGDYCADLLCRDCNKRARQAVGGFPLSECHRPWISEALARQVAS